MWIIEVCKDEEKDIWAKVNTVIKFNTLQDSMPGAMELMRQGYTARVREVKDDKEVK